MHPAETPPEPPAAATPEQFCLGLRSLREWAGSPSYTEIARRVATARGDRGVPEAERRPGRVTVYDCFRPDRRRLDVELVVDVVRALGVDAITAVRWARSCQAANGHATAASVVTTVGGLPPRPSPFVGRAAELALVRSAAGSGRALVAIEGMPGVGKTQLALRAAHDADGHEVRLFVDLRGYDPDRPPVDPSAVLDAFLRLLGMPGDQVQPLDLDQRAAAYRRRLAGRPALVVLDNAADEGHVRPLIPDDGPCLVLVTSRRHLAGLDGATHVRLDGLSMEESLELLGATAGADRVRAQRDGAIRLVELCRFLPLDLAVTAAQIHRRPEWSLDDHASRLGFFPRDEAVRPALASSYRHLSAAQRRLFRLLAVHPGGEMGPHAAAAIADVDLPTADDLLGQLRAEHLLQAGSGGRYGFHDLVRSYADRLLHEDEPHTEHRAAFTRLVDHYRHTAAVAMDAVAPNEQHRRPRVPDPGSPTPDLGEAGAALAWLDAERTTLLACATHAAAHGWPEHASHLAMILWRYLETAARFQDAEALHRVGLAATTDPGERSRLLSNLGAVYWRMGRYPDALAALRQALTAARDTGDRGTECQALNGVGVIAYLAGRYAEATDHFEQALAIARELGRRGVECSLLSNLGSLHERLGACDTAIDLLTTARTIAQEIEDQDALTTVLANLGTVHRRLGDGSLALDHYERAMTLARAQGNRGLEAHLLGRLGDAYALLGRHDLDLDHQRAALALARETDNREVEVDVLTSLGRALLNTGAVTEAVEQQRVALAAAVDLGDRPQQAHANDGLGHALAAAGEHAAADRHWRRALDLYAELGVPEADEVRATIAAASSRTD